MTIKSSDIRILVLSIIAKCANLSPVQLAPAHWEEPLTGRMFNLSAVDMAYILFEIEQEFNIRISPDALLHYGFSSINDICTVVQENFEHT